MKVIKDLKSSLFGIFRNLWLKFFDFKDLKNLISRYFWFWFLLLPFNQNPSNLFFRKNLMKDNFLKSMKIFLKWMNLPSSTFVKFFSKYITLSHQKNFSSIFLEFFFLRIFTKFFVEKNSLLIFEKFFIFFFDFLSRHLSSPKQGSKQFPMPWYFSFSLHWQFFVRKIN